MDIQPDEGPAEGMPETFKLVKVVTHERRDGRTRGWANDTDVTPWQRREDVVTGLAPDDLVTLIHEAADWLAYRGES